MLNDPKKVLFLWGGKEKTFAELQKMFDTRYSEGEYFVWFSSTQDTKEEGGEERWVRKMLIKLSFLNEGRKGWDVAFGLAKIPTLCFSPW